MFVRQSFKWLLYGTSATFFTSVGLCWRDRKGPSGRRDAALIWLEPRWYHTFAVTVASGLVDVGARALIAAQDNFEVTTDDDFALANSPDACFMRALKGQSVVFAANHVSMLDCCVISPLISRRLTGSMTPLWGLEYTEWPFAVGSTTLLFNNSLKAMGASLLCSMPVQNRYSSNGEIKAESTEAEFRAMNSRFLRDIIEVVKNDRKLVIFPEGRLWQERLEVRDEDGCWTHHNGVKLGPGERVGYFHSGVGKIIAHSGALFVPISHAGFDHILPSSGSYATGWPQTGQRAHLHIGHPVDFRPLITTFEQLHGPLDFEGPESDEMRALFHTITTRVREEVLRCHTICLDSIEVKASAIGACPVSNSKPLV